MRARYVARCRTVVSICRTVIIDCRIPRDGATLRALNTARGGPRIVHDAYEAGALQVRLCHIPSLVALARCIPLYLSSSPSVTRPFARVSDPAPTRSTVRSISSSSCFSSSSSSFSYSSSSSLEADLENCFFISPRSRIRHEPLDIPAIHRREYIGVIEYIGRPYRIFFFFFFSFIR